MKFENRLSVSIVQVNDCTVSKFVCEANHSVHTLAD